MRSVIVEELWRGGAAAWVEVGVGFDLDVLLRRGGGKEDKSEEISAMEGARGSLRAMEEDPSVRGLEEKAMVEKKLRRLDVCMREEEEHEGDMGMMAWGLCARCTRWLRKNRRR